MANEMTPAEGPVERSVRPRAWLYENKSGARVLHTDRTLVRFEADMRAATEYPKAHSMTSLYDQVTLDAAVAAERGRVLAAVEQRLMTWRQRTMNKSGDRLALEDFMSADSIADIVDYVCDEWA